MNPKSAEALENTNLARMKKLEELHEGTPRTPMDPEKPTRAAWNEFLNDSPKLLGKAFDGFESSAKEDKSFVNQHFSTKDYASRSPLLRKYASAGHVPSGDTLAQRVLDLTGRR